MRALVGVAAICLVVLVPSTTAMAAPVKHCGDSPQGGVYDIKAKNLSCRKARKMALGWYHHGRPMPAHFTCRLQSGPKPARCHHGRRSFSFVFSE